MVQKRDIVTCILLSIVTCGIYGIIWFIGLTDDVGRLSGDSEFTGTKYFLLTLVTCGIFGYVWAYKLGKNASCLMTVVDSIYKNTHATSEEREQGLTKMIELALDSI